MKKSVLLATALLAACSDNSGQTPRRAADLKTYDIEEPAAPAVREPAAPGVNVTSAPGVAFDYRYAFRLPANKISAVQEAHAQACEKLCLLYTSDAADERSSVDLGGRRI